jgi:hypothetical protein
MKFDVLKGMMDKTMSRDNELGEDDDMMIDDDGKLGDLESQLTTTMTQMAK